MKTKAINILSLFSGGGFLDIGFNDQGFQVEGACEIVPEFISSYNFGVKNYLNKSTKKEIINSNIHHTDIESPIDIASRKEQLFIKDLYKDKVQGVIGGPPCQDYSVGGKNKGVDGDRGKLIYSYLEVIKLIKPEFIFFENVSGLYSTRNHQSTFFDLVKELQLSGYHVWYDVLNSLDYGIPQDRSRLVLVGFRIDIIKRLLHCGYKLDDNNKDSNELIFRWPKKIFNNPKQMIWPKLWSFGSDILEHETQLIPERYKKLTVVNAFKNLSTETPNNNEVFTPYSKKFQTISEGDTNRKSFKRLHRYRYSPTVAYGNNEVHLHPTEPRRLTVREALRLQTAPDLYVLPSDVSLTHKFKLISNGVPTREASLLAKEIKRTLSYYYHSINKQL